MRPPRYYDQDFMTQRSSRINGVPLHLKNGSGAPNENIVQNHLNIALLNVF